TRAWSSIWASNVSSLMTATILYSFGTSLVRGFAITLVIGVLVSMFTAIVVSRTFLRLIVRG
ncbi:MAG: preprotein translocase subunit SecD, partial [Microgenomates group bacterium Gr01-1014_80]